MFLENSRYAKVATSETKRRDGTSVKALKLRRLPATPGDPTAVRQGDQLDVMALRATADPTKFWRIADANTELEAKALVAEVDRVIGVPVKR